jgi:hypothetical protein
MTYICTRSNHGLCGSPLAFPSDASAGISRFRDESSLPRQQLLHAYGSSTSGRADGRVRAALADENLGRRPKPLILLGLVLP